MSSSSEMLESGTPGGETVTPDRRTEEPGAFEAACMDVSLNMLCAFFKFSRHRDDHARVQDGPAEGFGLMDGEASLVLPAHHRQGQGSFVFPGPPSDGRGHSGGKI